MQTVLAGDVLREPEKHDGLTVYVPADVDLELSTPVLLLDAESGIDAGQELGYEYFLEVDLIDRVLEGARARLGRPLAPEEALRAVLHYVAYDAPPPEEVLLGRDHEREGEPGRFVVAFSGPDGSIPARHLEASDPLGAIAAADAPAAEGTMAFVVSGREGASVYALQEGKWVLVRQRRTPGRRR